MNSRVLCVLTLLWAGIGLKRLIFLALLYGVPDMNIASLIYKTTRF